MTLQVYTARIGIRDPDALDITRGSGRGALAFAPSVAILTPAIRARRAAQRKREAAAELEAREEGAGATARREADELEEAAWAIYEPLYVAEMRVSWGLSVERYGGLERAAVGNGVKPDRGAWKALLARPRVVLTCFCTDPDRCHRRLLARILAKCGAEDRGELLAPGPAAAHRDLKPVNIELEREELERLVVALGQHVREWADLAA